MEKTQEAGAVRHNEAEQRFEIAVGTSLAVAEYTRNTDGIVMTHTFVPPDLRGRGLAERLVRAALEHARAQNWRVVPACSYVAGFIERHPAYQDLRAGR
ncbi:MAG: N-acetyltransferase [Verrucomicrobia bacterium]|nr:N-acetyltransferase [Verrucomicrobiota bacterium]